MPQERPEFMWISFYRRPPNAESVECWPAPHVGTCIVEAPTPELGLRLARELGIAPADCDCVTQGLSKESRPVYAPHLNKLMGDQELVAAFGEDGVLCLDRKTTLGEVLEQERRQTYRPPAIERTETIECDYSDESLPIEELPFRDYAGGSR